MISCEDLRGLGRELESAWRVRREALGVLLGTFLEGSGRVSVAKRCGMSERRVRTVRSALLERCGADLSRCGSVRAFVERARFTVKGVNDRLVTALYPLGEGVLRAVRGRIVSLRDLLVVELGSPAPLEVVGLSTKEGPEIPAIPAELAEGYTRLARLAELPSDSVFAFWKGGGDLMLVSALVSALTRLCETGSSVVRAEHGNQQNPSAS